MKWAALIVMAALLGGCRTTSNLEPVSGFDLNRYLGKWYEMARYDHRFEKGLSSVSAEYRLNADGTVKVLNRGFNDSERKWEEAVGIAKPEGAENTGFLKVSFFRPFYASYKIVYLSPDYTEAIVAGPTYRYFWILARNPALPENDLNRLIRVAEKLGFQKEQMLLIDQKENLK